MELSITANNKYNKYKTFTGVAATFFCCHKTITRWRSKTSPGTSGGGTSKSDRRTGPSPEGTSVRGCWVLSCFSSMPRA
jgi:hypothetical protein